MIELNESAVTKLKQLFEEENNPALKLPSWVAKGKSMFFSTTNPKIIPK